MPERCDGLQEEGFNTKVAKIAKAAKQQIMALRAKRRNLLLRELCR